MKLINGIADAGRAAAVTNSDTQTVLVTDGGDHVELSLGTSNFPAMLTADQARKIAKELVAASKRIE